VDGVILINARGEIQKFNPACEKLFGYRAAEVIGENVKVLMPSPYRDEHDEYLSNYLSTGERKIIGIGREVQGQRKDGSIFPMDLSVGEAEQDGEAIFVGVLHDLTERKRTEEQLAQAQKMEAVGQLSGGIAHDFNNLLTVIIGNADDLVEKLKPRPDLQKLAKDVVAAGTRGGELTQRLLAFSRRQTLRPVEIDCNRLIESMRSLLRRTLREDIRLDLHLESDLLATSADPGQLEAAILNLALNSQDAMPQGGSLSIATANIPLDEEYKAQHPEVAPGHYVMIAVTDDGVGIPREILERVFEPFFTTKEVGKGSGLGLSMVYGFVKQSNGHVGIYSEPGLGTTVRIYLPSMRAEAASLSTEESGVEMSRGRGETILVTEDDAFVQAYAVASIESLGYRVIAAANGHEALAKIEALPEISLLFTDIVMPGGMSGWELADRARRLRPGLKVLVTSGYALESLAARGLIKPDLAFLTKPYRKPELSRRLQEVLRS
jgi:PAS domain S-box-containing protein